MVPIFYNLSLIFIMIRDEYPELGINPDNREVMINKAVEFLRDLWVSQTYPTSDFLIEACCKYYGKNKITKTDLEQWINFRLFHEERVLSTVSNNHTIQVTKNFQVNGHKRLLEVLSLLED